MKSKSLLFLTIPALLTAGIVTGQPAAPVAASLPLKAAARTVVEPPSWTGITSLTSQKIDELGYDYSDELEDAVLNDTAYMVNFPENKFRSSDGWYAYSISSVSLDLQKGGALQILPGFWERGIDHDFLIKDCYEPFYNEQTGERVSGFDYDLSRPTHFDSDFLWFVQEELGDSIPLVFDRLIADFDKVSIAPVRVDNWSYDHILHDGEDQDVTINVDDHLTQEQLLTHVTSKDMFGGEVDYTVQSSNYVPGKIGTYDIVLHAADKYGLTATATVHVNVRDYTSPLVTIIDSVRVPVGGSITAADFLTHLSITDNVDPVDQLTVTYGLPTGFGWGLALNTVTSYNVDVSVTDKSSHVTRLTVPVTVYDNVAPVISRVDGGTLANSIQVGYTTVDSTIDKRMLALFKAVDAVDGACEVSIESGTIAKEIGDYKVVFTAKDKSNNKATLEVTFSVIADIPPVFVLDGNIAVTSTNYPLGYQDLIALAEHDLIARGAVYKNVEIMHDDGYLATGKTAGDYTIDYSFLNATSTKYSYSFTVRAVEMDDAHIDASSLSVGGRISMFFQSIGHWFKNVFTKFDFSWHWVYDNKTVVGL